LVLESFAASRREGPTRLGTLRILLALCVFSAHAGKFVPLRWLTGDLALELFFVISGFYMQLVLSTKYTRSALGDAWRLNFYKARYFRLMPVYLACSTMVIGASLLDASLAPLPTWNYIANLPNTAGNVLFKVFISATNATLLFQDVTMFLATRGGIVHWTSDFAQSDVPLWTGLTVPPAWSLGIELSFYIIAPFILGLRSSWLALFAVCALTAKMAVLWTLDLSDPWTYRFFPFAVGYFMLGALAFRYRETLSFTGFLQVWSEKYCAYLIVAAIAICRIPVPCPTLVYPGGPALILPFLFRVTGKLKTDRLIGELSYSFYIFHWFGLVLGMQILRYFNTSMHFHAWASLFVTVLLSAVALALDNRFIEPWRERLGYGLAKPRLAG
jgi:peptidoglycan/LPS O-acetylase OafA/YrhL